MGLRRERHFTNDHRALNRATWSARQGDQELGHGMLFPSQDDARGPLDDVRPMGLCEGWAKALASDNHYVHSCVVWSMALPLGVRVSPLHTNQDAMSRVMRGQKPKSVHTRSVQ